MAALARLQASWQGTTDAQRRERESWQQPQPTRIELLKRAYYEAKVALRKRIAHR
jgi:hypothetical protein